MEITCEIAERTPGATGVEGAGKPVGTRAARPSKAHNPAPASFPNYPLKSAKLQTHCLKMTDFRRYSPNGSALWRNTPRGTSGGETWLRRPWAAVGLGRTTSRRAGHHQSTRLHWCGGRRRDRRAWLRCPWAVAGPGRASRRCTEQHKRPSITGVEGAGGSGGHGRASRRGAERSEDA